MMNLHSIRKWIVSISAPLLLLLLVIWTLGLIGIEKAMPGVTPLPPNPAAARKTALVERQSATSPQSWPGTVKAANETRLSPKFTARILEIKVRAGDQVKRGAVIARLDAAQNEAAERAAASLAAAASAEAARAEADLRRTRGLFEQEAATREDYEHAEANARKARANAGAASFHVRETALQRGETVLRAPFDAVITERLREPGDMGLAGEAIVILHDAAKLRLEAALPASCANQIRVGDNAKARIDALQSTFDAEIDEIVPAADPVTGTVLIKARVQTSPKLQPGLYGWLEYACGDQQDSLMIPSTALRRIGQVEIVTVVEQSGQSIRHVRSGAQRGEQIEILSGLDAGETVALE